FDTAVIQVAFGHPPAGGGGDTLGVDLKFMILGGEVHRSCRFAAYRMVAPVVAKRESRCGSADRTADDLVAKADAENRHVPLDEATYNFNLGRKYGWVAWPV